MTFKEYLKSDNWNGKTDESIMYEAEKLDAKYFHRCQIRFDEAKRNNFKEDKVNNV